MRTARPKSLLERTPDSDLWRHTLSQIPTHTGRLVYLAGLRSPVTGKYEHHGFALMFGEDEADRAIRFSHKRMFAEFLSFSLEEKVEDLASYIRSTGEVPREVVRHWSRNDLWKSFTPLGALSAEKSLFCSEIKNSMRILSQRFSDGAPDHTA